MDKALLPAGFHDLLFPEAGKKAAVMSQLFAAVARFGYELVDPPSIEFENSLFTGAGKSFKNQTFRIMDPLSHKMMGVRCDITTQVARIAATRLKHENFPLRLSYGGDVFRVKGEGLYTQRQLTQGGIELIGVDCAEADAEAVLVIISALKAVGVKDICIDFTLPRLIDIILSEAEYKQYDKIALRHAISKKNIAQIKKIAGKDAAILIALASSNIKLADIKDIKLPKSAKPLVERLSEVIKIIEASKEDIKISIDPAEPAKFAYHTGVGFTIFSRKSKSEIGRGGRYEIDSSEESIPATGATIYIDEILRILPAQKTGKRVFVPFGTTWQEVQKITKEENILIFGIREAKNVAKEARLYKCDYVFKNGKIAKI